MRFNINNTADKQVLPCVYFVIALLGGAFFGESLFANEEIIHVVKNGDTVYGLAREYGVKVEEILFLNGIDDARKIQSGQRIRIPSTPVMVPPINPDPNAPSVSLHWVQKGETLFGIARQYNIPIQEIQSVNNFTNAYVLKAGDVIKIPLASQIVAEIVPALNTATLPAASRIIDSAAARTTVPPSSPSSIRTVNPNLLWPIRPEQAAYMTGKLSGVALVGQHGEGIRCIYPGTVLSAMPYRGFGRVVIVKSAEGYLYVYGGCETLLVKAGDYVTTGTELGRLGIDSVSGQPALFFMVYLNNNAVDPALAPRG